MNELFLYGCNSLTTCMSDTVTLSEFFYQMIYDNITYIFFPFSQQFVIFSQFLEKNSSLKSETFVKIMQIVPRSFLYPPII
jgi:hypothetical protein